MMAKENISSADVITVINGRLLIGSDEMIRDGAKQNKANKKEGNVDVVRYRQSL